MVWDASVWEQGGFMPASALPDDLRAQHGQIASFLILSHDCDLHRRSDTEPFVELLPCHVTESRDKVYMHARDPRTLHLETSQNGAKRSFYLRAHEKFTVRKDDVDCSEGGTSSETLAPLSAANKEILRTWLVARYKRQALPDALNAALRAFQEVFKKKASTLSDSIDSVWIWYDPHEEVEPGDGYSCIYYFVYDGSCTEARTKVETFVNFLQTDTPGGACIKTRLKEGRPRVDVRFEAVDDEAFTLRMTKTTVRWFYDGFSLRDGTDVPRI